VRSHFVCWDPDGQDDPGDDAPERNKIAGVLCVEGAAEVYAERLHGDGDPFDEVVVMVRDLDGLIHRVMVTVDWSPEFYATTEAS
jgi:hypothetical protein